MCVCVVNNFFAQLLLESVELLLEVVRSGSDNFCKAVVGQLLAVLKSSWSLIQSL